MMDRDYMIKKSQGKDYTVTDLFDYAFELGIFPTKKPSIQYAMYFDGRNIPINQDILQFKTSKEKPLRIC